MNQNSWIIGLTGPIVSGKSTALMYFKAQGAEVISCDEIVRQLYTRPAVCKRIKSVLGTTDKIKIAELVFKQAAQRKQLEQLLHPLVRREVRTRIRQHTQALVVVEVPLLFEAGWEKLFDLTVCVLADPKTLPARLKARKLNKAEYRRRLKNQLSPEEKAARADVVFFHATKAQLKQSITRFCNVLKVVHKVK